MPREAKEIPKPKRHRVSRRDENSPKKHRRSVHILEPLTYSAEELDLLLAAYKVMFRARRTDEKAIVLYKQNKAHFQIGVAGHEAVQVAASQIFDVKKDWFYPYYRDMALCSGLGMTSQEFMLNVMNKRDDPNSHGRQMPMHYGSKRLRIISQSSPTGTQFLQAVGCALASRKLGQDAVVYVSAGEGTCAQGDFHEACNWAARERLPVIFLIENNHFAISVPIEEQIAGRSVHKMSRGYTDLETIEIDGTDFWLSYESIRRAYRRAKDGLGPTLIEAHVPRLQSHSISDNHLKYRSSEEVSAQLDQCPIRKARNILLENEAIEALELEKIEQEIISEIDQAADWAEAQSDCLPEDADTYIFTDSTPWVGINEHPADGPEIFMVDAINHALEEELARDPLMYVFGQDVAGGKGGVFTVTAGLTDKFGESRVFNAPLAESSIIGVAIGMATSGLRPVPEIQFGDYIWTAMMQIRNELATMSYRSAGDFTAPVVVRVPVGGYIHGGPYHSQNIEGTFAHFPGLYICYPSNATDAKGMLKAAIRGKDPVLFLEHKGLYRQVYAKGPEGDVDSLVPLGKAKVIREGNDVTIVTYGAMVHRAINAANILSKEGISLHILDLRTIVPFDRDAVSKAVQKTNRVIVAQEDVLFMGFGAEITAFIAEECFQFLDAPVMRVGMKKGAFVPHSPALEAVVLPTVEDILQAARSVRSF